MQLVSVTPRDVAFDADGATDVISDEFSEPGNEPLSLDFSADPRGSALALTEQWLQRRDQIEEQMSKLEQLLDAIASQRSIDSPITDRVGDRSESAESARSPVDPQNLYDEGMILLSAATAVDFDSQAMDVIDDAAIGQWSVGIGVHRGMQLAGSDEFPAALTLAWVADAAAAAAASSLPPVDARLPARVASPGNALGIVLCGIGIHYLRQRRKSAAEFTGDRLIVAAALPVPDDEDS